MNRRTLLAGAGSVLAATVAGCVENGAREPAGDGSGGDRVADVEFLTRGDAPVDADLGDEPAVEVDEDAGQVRVEGRYAIGDGCHEEALLDPVYDEETDTLSIALSREHDGREECELEDQEVPYRVVVTVDGPLPGVVEVSKDGGASGEETRVEL